MTRDYDEELPLGVVPMLAFGDTRLGDIDADLSAIQGVDQLRETASVIHIHLQGECHLLFRKIREIRGV